MGKIMAFRKSKRVWNSELLIILPKVSDRLCAPYIASPQLKLSRVPTIEKRVARYERRDNSARNHTAGNHAEKLFRTSIPCAQKNCSHNHQIHEGKRKIRIDREAGTGGGHRTGEKQRTTLVKVTFGRVHNRPQQESQSQC